jgi:hypothetical protein
MKRLIVRENTQGRTAKVNASKTYQTKSGKWIAEVDGEDFHEACFILCDGIEGCTCENLHVEADQDDDGKEYRVLTS